MVFWEIYHWHEIQAQQEPCAQHSCGPAHGSITAVHSCRTSTEGKCLGFSLPSGGWGSPSPTKGWSGLACKGTTPQKGPFLERASSQKVFLRAAQLTQLMQLFCNGNESKNSFLPLWKQLLPWYKSSCMPPVIKRVVASQKTCVLLSGFKFYSSPAVER